MKTIDLALEAQGKYLLLADLVEQLSAARTRESQARITHEQSKESMAKIHRDRVLDISPTLVGTKDPKTGHPNKEWSEFILGQALERDAAYCEALGLMFATQEEVTLAQTEVLNIADHLGVAKAAARLLAAMMEYASSMREHGTI